MFASCRVCRVIYQSTCHSTNNFVYLTHNFSFVIWQEDLFAVWPTCDIIFNVAELCVCVCVCGFPLVVTCWGGALCVVCRPSKEIHTRPRRRIIYCPECDTVDKQTWTADWKWCTAALEEWSYSAIRPQPSCSIQDFYSYFSALRWSTPANQVRRLYFAFFFFVIFFFFAWFFDWSTYYSTYK